MKARKRGGIENHPYEATLASVMLDAAVQASDRSQSHIRQALGYSSQSTLSHYATGLNPIPVNAAERIALEVGLDVGAFTIAVLRQRYPEIMDKALVPPAFDASEVAAMRARLTAEGRSAALELFPLLRAGLEGPQLSL